MRSLGSNSAHGESKLSARGVQTQHVVPPPAVHCPPTPNATCLAQSPHHHAALATFALARRRSPSPHACLARLPHHHTTPAALAGPPRLTPASPTHLTIMPPSSPSPLPIAGCPRPMPASPARLTIMPP